MFLQGALGTSFFSTDAPRSFLSCHYLDYNQEDVCYALPESQMRDTTGEGQGVGRQG